MRSAATVRLPVFAPRDADARPVAFALVDSTDFARLATVRWTLTARGYAQARYEGRPVRLHVAVMGRSAGHIDHANGMKLDCRRSNLRPATASQNSANRPVFAGVTGYKGVHPFRGKWRAKIQVDGVQRHLGVFGSPELAAAAYDSAALEAWGEFAWPNQAVPLIASARRTMGGAR